MINGEAFVLAVVIGISVTLAVMAPFVLVAVMGHSVMAWRRRRRAARLQRTGGAR